MGSGSHHRLLARRRLRLSIAPAVKVRRPSSTSPANDKPPLPLSPLGPCGPVRPVGPVGPGGPTAGLVATVTVLLPGLLSGSGALALKVALTELAAAVALTAIVTTLLSFGSMVPKSQVTVAGPTTDAAIGVPMTFSLAPPPEAGGGAQVAPFVPM